ncbi:hypothetical protein ABZX40_29440 [Streptomyces sp. NPDC004610]|uniref:hypothetical protein n=1 Tax=unclassified Streptomyces TaxID=2593676 RepID=UPI00339FBA68
MTRSGHRRWHRGVRVGTRAADGGFEAEVYEAHPDTAEGMGAALLPLASNGMRASAGFDATAAVTTLGSAPASIRPLDASGAEAAHAPMDEAAVPEPNLRRLRRGDLNAAVRGEAVRRGVPVTRPCGR